MADKKKMSVAEILAAARKTDSSQSEAGGAEVARVQATCCGSARSSSAV